MLLDVCGNNIMIPIPTHSHDFVPIFTAVSTDNQDTVYT